MPLIASLNGLKVYFYDQKDKRFIRAVENASLSIDMGSVLGLVGESGCGKTVTALSMMGLVDSEPGIIGGEFYFKPKKEDRRAVIRAILRGFSESINYRRGELVNLLYGLESVIEFRHNPLTIIKDNEQWLRRHNRIMEHIRGKNISMIFQNPLRSINPFTQVGAQLMKTIGRFNQEREENEIYEMAVELLKSTMLYNPEDIMKMYPGSLSLGMAQRVIIAIALASNPTLLIADEPTSGLDTTNRYRIIDLLETIIDRMNLTLVLISHNIQIVGLIASHVAVMYAGIIVESGSKRDVIGRKHGPKHPYTQALVSSMPTDSDIRRGKRLRVIPGTVPDNKIIIRGCPFIDRCPYAKGRIRRRCREKCPDPFEVGKNHFIRCYLYY